MAHPARILVVDDTPGNRYAVARLLRGAGMQVDEAENGTSALRLVTTHPDLVVLDINLPDFSGYEVCRSIKSNPETARIPVMHLSASYTASADRAFGLEAGADAYLTHPLDPAVFLATTRALLRASEAEAEFHRAAREWRVTFDAIRDAIFLIGSDGTVHRCNRAAARLVRAEPSEVVAWSWHGVVAGLRSEQQAMLRDLPTRHAGQWEVEVDDTDYRVTTHLASFDRPSDQLIVVAFADVTAERNAQRERERIIDAERIARSEAEGARREAEAANRAKADFLAVMSHELRTPLNAIGGFTDLISMGVRGPVTHEQLRDLEKIRRSQVTLMGLINDLLSFAKLESGSVEFESVEVALCHAMTSAVELVEEQARERGLQLERADCDESIVVRADREKLQQILLNLLSNSVKFTEAGGTISLTGERTADRVLITVRDTGRGIPQDKLSTIFDPFMQVDQRLARSSQGVGLGLAISRDLAHGMGGELTVESVVGEGSTFTLSLPG